VCISEPGIKAQARQFDLSPFEPIVFMHASRTFVNGRLACVCGDQTVSGIEMLGVSERVYIEGRRAHRRGDINSLYLLTTTGSPDTFVG